MDQVLTSKKKRAASPPSRPALTVMVPFYKNPQLVSPLFESIRACQAELRELNAQVVFYNDSPDDEGLRAELHAALLKRGGLALSVVENAENLGFVGTVNAAFDNVVEAGGDIVIVNSDTVIFPGVFREMSEVAYTDPMIGFVCPRSNNATIATFPHGADQLQLTPDEHYARFKALAPLLPRLTYVPVAVGFCLYIKGHILRDLGGFDVAYGKGYNEENDLICRANQYGYRAVLANHAFTWHQGEQSFSTLEEGKAKRDQENAKLLNSRYPDYLPRVWAYFDSPEYMAERVLAGLAPDGQYRQRIGFDFSNFGSYHNGTFEAGKKLLAAAVDSWPLDLEIVVLCGRDAFDFHGLKEEGRVRWCDTHEPNTNLTAMVRMGQIFDQGSMSRLLVRAPVIAIFMLDTISADCGYLSVSFDALLWAFVMKWSDIVFGISRFTTDQLRRRYPLGSRTALLPVLLSVAPEEYSPAHPEQFDGDHTLADKPRRLLVIGNKFKHKGMELAVTALAEALPETKIVALGLKQSDWANVEAIASGDLSDEEVDDLYRQADAVVFPTHYEGFGFPLVHAMARQRPIYVRRLPVFEEIAAKFSVGQQNIRWFSDHNELIIHLQNAFRGWQGPPAVGETAGWTRCADEVHSALQTSIQAVSYDAVFDRLRWFYAAFCRPEPALTPEPFGVESDPAERVADFVSQKLRRLLMVLFRNKLAYHGVRFFWRILRSGRTA